MGRSTTSSFEEDNKKLDRDNGHVDRDLAAGDVQPPVMLKRGDCEFWVLWLKAMRSDLACLEPGKPIAAKFINFATQFFKRETLSLKPAPGHFYITRDFMLHLPLFDDSDWYNATIDLVYNDVFVFNHVQTKVVTRRAHNDRKMVTLYCLCCTNVVIHTWKGPG